MDKNGGVKKTLTRSGIISLILMILLPLTLSYAYNYWQRNYSAEALKWKNFRDKAENERAMVVGVVERVLKAWKSGSDSYLNKTGTSLFSVKSWKIIDVYGGLVIAIVESSTQGGFPIRKTWKFWISTSEGVLIDISEANVQ